MIPVPGLEPIDWEIFYKLLKVMEVKMETEGLSAFLALLTLSERSPLSEAFPPIAAREMMEKLFTWSEQEKLTRLMAELKSENSSLVAKACLEKNRELEKIPKSVTCKVFKEIESISADTLDLLGLIRIEPEHFQESHDFLAEMLRNFKNVERKKRNEQRKYKKEEVKWCASKALEELEKLVSNSKKQGQSENKPEENTSTVPNSKPTEQNQTKVEGSEGDDNPKKKEQVEPQGSTFSEQRKNGPENGYSPKQTDFPSSSDGNKDNQNQNLKELKADAVAEVNQVMQEAKITDQDLTETNRQWKSLIENSNDREHISNIKEKLLAVIRQVKKEKENSNKLTELVKGGEEENDPAELKKIIEQIEKFRGEKIYDSLKGRISALRKKLADQDINGYCNTNKEMIEKELQDEGIKENELDAEVREKLKKMKEGGIKQTEIDAIKDKVSDNIKLKKVEKELENLLKDYQENTSSGQEKDLAKKILTFKENTNSFYQQVYQKRKDEVEKLLSLLKKGNSSQQSPPARNSFPLLAKAAIGGFLLVIAVVIFFKKPAKIKRAKLS